ncbi:MAG: hypothetical protein A3D94_14645 [Alphaproteobacteria bacterium RIFCSPHIGHO2_12_FULL_66_14]|nr:MAG: hypothetical protein A3D94_14645 [Alphaproteobacteria bacterium RIFCSPHIGHO2_12_FULL_66_14]
MIVLAYREDVQPLMAALEKERLPASVQRIEYSNEELTYARSSRLLLNHRLAWEKAAALPGYTLICESDFVPCRGMGGFPVFWPVTNARAWGYLYQGSPRLLALSEGQPVHLRAHVSATVAYVINATVAKILLEYFNHVSATYGLTHYFSFEAFLQWFVTGKGGAAYMPWRHYGEHGGLPNAEHASIGKLRHGGEHHADNLMAGLHFLPQYARQSTVRFLLVRAKWRLLGIGRLLFGRWIVRTNVYDLSFGDRWRMFLAGAARLAPRLPGLGR